MRPHAANGSNEGQPVTGAAGPHAPGPSTGRLAGHAVGQLAKRCSGPLARRLVGVPLLLLLGGCPDGGMGGGSGGSGTGSGGSSTGGTVGTGGQAAGSGGAAGGNATGGASGGATASGGTGGSQTDGGGTGGSAVGGGGGGTGGSAVGGGGGGQGGTAGTRTGGAGGGGPAGGMGGTQSGGRGGGNGGGGGGGGGAAGAGGATAAFDRAAVMSIMRRVADYEISRFGTGNDNGWVRATFHTGMLAAYRALGDVKYRDYTRQWGQANNWQLKAGNGGLRFADNQTCVQSYAELYLADPVASNNVLLTAAQTTFDAMVAAPMAGRTEWWWCDALYMAPPALVRVAQATGKTQYVTLMHNMFWDTKAFLFDPVQSLFWRDSTFRNTNTFWSRGNGWVVGGIVRVLEVLPATDARRGEYEDLLRLMTTKLRTIQAADGFWRSSLTQPNAFTTPESSGTAFFTFGMAWGINHGVLDRATYLPTVMRGWTALVSAVNAQGRLGWVQAVGAQPGASAMADTNDYATGAFLLAGNEILKL